MQTKRLRWGVLGTARIADALVQGIKRCENGELAAIASREPHQAEEWAGKRGVPHAFGSYEEMLGSDVIDAVYIPLPNGLHKEWSIKAMQQGKHVLCEKPLAGSAADVREMMATADKAGVKLMEAFMYRFHPATTRLAELLVEGAIGTPKVIRATFGFRLSKPEDIRWSAELAGGSVMDVGCYCVNIVRLLAGAEPAAVTGRASWAPTGVDESMAGTLEFPGGLLANVDCSFSTGVNMQQYLMVSGTDGRIVMNQPFRRAEKPVEISIDRSDGGDYPSHVETVEVPGAYQYALMAEHFADAVLNDLPLRYTPENSLGNMLVIDALKQSARTGQTVQMGG